MTTTGSYQIVIDSSKIYASLLREIYKNLTGKANNIKDVDTLINSCLIMMCGKKSRDELNGTKVKIEQLTDTDGFDGYR